MYPCKRDSETLEIDKWRRGDMMVEQREMQPGAKESQSLEVEAVGNRFASGGSRRNLPY